MYISDKHSSKIQSIMKSMTLEEKIAFCSGANFWQTKELPGKGVPSMFMTDGPHGLRKQDLKKESDMLGINKSLPATCFPAAVLSACSFDEDLLFRIGEAIGEEALSLGVGLVLGPGLNIKRNPLCGRNFEYFSEDPYLAGKMAAAFVRGVQSKGVGACLKHFACNDQETDRFQSDSILDERTLREIYLTAFEIAVKESRPAAVMSSYNKINGTYASDSRKLLTEILREEWGFDGFVVTDWGGMNDRIRAFEAGCDLMMPGGSDYMEKECLAAVREGRLSEEDIDRSVKRILERVFLAEEALKNNDAEDNKKAEGLENREKTDPVEEMFNRHHELAAEAAAKSAVLLKNRGKLLPLNADQKIVLIGDMAKRMRYQGSGSSHINPARLTNPTDAMPDYPWVQGCNEEGETTDALIEEACRAAEEADVAVVFAGLPDRYESEGFDREHMQLPEGHNRLIDAVRNANPKTVVVLFCGGAVELPCLFTVPSILYMGLPGQAGGEAVRRILFGEVNPSGKMAECWPKDYTDCISSSYYAKTRDALYLEGIFTGYRYYEKVHMPTAAHFGSGLSYTKYKYKNLVSEGNRVSVEITNAGDRAGDEIVQLYVTPGEDILLYHPRKELRRFCKVHLEPGETKTVSFELDERCFAVWQEGWRIPRGSFYIELDVLKVLADTSWLEEQAEELPVPSWQEESWYQNCKEIPGLLDLELASGISYLPKKARKGSYTMNNSIVEMKEHSLVMKIMYRAIASVIRKSIGKDKGPEDPEFKMMLNASAGAPLRSVQISAGLKGSLLRGLLAMANGHFFRGIREMIRG